MTEAAPASAELADGVAPPPPGAHPALGTPIEVPWWTPVAVLPPLLTLLAGALLGAPVETRVTVVVVSLATIYVIGLVAVRVSSRNMQSVAVSAVYAFWFFTALLWATTAWPPHLLA